MRRAGFVTFKLVIFAAIIIFMLASQSAAAAPLKQNKILNNLNIYQLGEADVVISFNGKDLPEPEIILSDDLLQFKFINSENKLNYKNYDLNAVPLVLDCEIKDLSGDVLINIATQRPMQIHSRNRGTFRFELKGNNKNNIKLSKPVKDNLNLAVIFPKNEKISFEADDISLREVFSLFVKYINKNVIIDASFPVKNITMSLHNMPLYDAVRNFMAANNIAFRLLDNNTVVFGSADGLSHFSGSEKLAKINIAYADLKELQERLIKLLNLNGEKIIVDNRTRDLYIKTNPEKLALAKNLIQKLDSPGRQVKIYARIFEFTDNYNK